MNILVISNYFPPYFKGGYELSCKAMVDFLNEKGENVTVLCGDYTEGKGVEPKYNVIRSLKYIDYINGSYLAKSRIEKENYVTTKNAIKELSPDVVYFWNQQYISLGPYLAVKHKRIKHLFDIGDIWPEKYKREGLSNKVKSLVKRILPNFVEGKLVLNPVVILSEWMREIVVENHHAKEVHVIPRGIHINKNIEVNNSNDTVRLMFASRIEPLKGIDMLFKALVLVKNDNWTLDIYGDGEEAYLEELKAKLIETNLDKKTVFKGMIYPLDVEYNKHDVFLFPTLAKEGFGRVVIEAMSYGLPVITVDRYGPADIVTHTFNGFKCSPHNINDWVLAIEAILDNRELRLAMSNNALDTVKEKYDINIVHQKRYDIIKQIHN